MQMCSECIFLCPSIFNLIIMALNQVISPPPHRSSPQRPAPGWLGCRVALPLRFNPAPQGYLRNPVMAGRSCLAAAAARRGVSSLTTRAVGHVVNSVLAAMRLHVFTL